MGITQKLITESCLRVNLQNAPTTFTEAETERKTSNTIPLKEYYREASQRAHDKHRGCCFKRGVKFLMRGGHEHREEICDMHLGTMNSTKAAVAFVSPFSDSPQTRAAIVTATKHGLLV